MGNCLEVDDNSGDYTNEQYCIANCQADTSSSDSSSSVHEFYMDIAIYPNPFTHSTTLEFKEKVITISFLMFLVGYYLVKLLTIQSTISTEVI